jgi:plasmid stabilization system protein ParE
MSLAIQRAAYFIADFEIQFAWYVKKAGADVAWRFQSALDDSLRKLSVQPDLGRVRHFGEPKLRDVRSYQVKRPFRKLLIFYRVDGNCLQAIRLMHGTRDLPRRLAEPPGAETSEASSEGEELSQ